MKQTPLKRKTPLKAKTVSSRRKPMKRSQPRRDCRTCGERISDRNTTGLCRRCCMAMVGRQNGMVKELRVCENCGAEFEFEKTRRERFCSWDCYVAGRGMPSGEDHWSWKGDEVGYWGRYNRAQKTIKAGPCEVCGKPNADRHHIDQNTLNNDPSNIAFLCRRHHTQTHAGTLGVAS